MACCTVWEGLFCSGVCLTLSRALFGYTVDSVQVILLLTLHQALSGPSVCLCEVL